MGIKGIVMTLDAIIAMMLMVSIISLLIFFRTESSSPFFTAQQLHSLSEDELNILSKSTLREVISNQTLLYDLNQSGDLSDSYWDDRAIEVIGMLWSENKSEAAASITKDILGNILPANIGYQALINNDNVYNSSQEPERPPYGDATTEISSGRIASGYQKGGNTTGCVARAYLKSVRIDDSSYVYFGGYVGDGNITVNITLPHFDKILEAYMEMDVGSNFTLYINNTYAGNYSNGTAGGGLMRADKWVVCNTTYNSYTCSNFTEGSNTLKISFIGNAPFIGGGYFRVTYNTTKLTPQEEVGKDVYWFPGIAGFFNLYDSMYIPGTLINMTSYLHYFNNFTLNETNATVYLSIGNVAVFRSNETGNVNMSLNFSDIWKNFSSSTSLINNVSNKTVPLRFGIEGFQLKPGVGTADAVLITDVSGTMDTDDVSCPPNVIWQISTLSYQGSYGAQNQKINNSQTVCMYRNVILSSAGRIYFWWRVSSQSNRDYLNFYIDSLRQSRISGNSTWATVDYAIASGTHEIKWCYTKDSSQSSYSDTGYVDSIVVNDTSGTVFFSDDFESGDLNGWSFSSSGPNCQRLDAAKTVDNVFVDIVLDTPGDRVGLVSYSDSVSGTHPLSNNSAALKGNITNYQTGGCTCTSCGISSANQMLDAAKNPLRFQGLLVMSDGYANRCLLGNNCGIYGTSPDCSDSYDPNYPAKLEAINMSCAARSNNYTVFSVGFGSSADSITLQRIACWNCSTCKIDLDCIQYNNASYSWNLSTRKNNCLNGGCNWTNVFNGAYNRTGGIGWQCVSNQLFNSSCWIGNVTLPDGTKADCRDVRYAQSNDLNQLTQIYQGFGQMFVNLGYTTQKANISSNMNFNNILYPDSRIEFQYSPVIIPDQYGEISLTRETPRLGDLTDYNITKPYKEGWFNISDKVKVVDAEMTSYSSDYWTDMLWINSSATGNWKEVYNLTYWGNDYTILGDPFIIHIPVDKISSGNNSVRIETGLCPNNSMICKLNKTGGSPDDRVIYKLRVSGSVGYGNVNESCEGAVEDAKQRLINITGGLVSGDIQDVTSNISSVQYMWGPAIVRIRVWS